MVAVWGLEAALESVCNVSFAPASPSVGVTISGHHCSWVSQPVSLLRLQSAFWMDAVGMSPQRGGKC
jgi:hypothetical protein